MRRWALMFCAVALCGAGALAQEDESDDEAAPSPGTNPEAGGIVLRPSAGAIAPTSQLTISFPKAMVAAAAIDVAEQPCPFVSEPKLEGAFLWKSQTEGVFTVAGVVAGARHRLHLTPGLKDATGALINAPDWSAEFRAKPFTISSDFEERKQLAALPQINLEASYPVPLAEAAEHVYFQDRDTHERFPVEVILAAEEKETSALEAREFRVTPRAPLPIGHTFDLIVNGLLEAKSRQPLPYLQVTPAGTTAPLAVEWLGAFNHALEKPEIRMKFNDEIEPAEATPEKIRVEPPVSELRVLADGDLVRITGKFDPTQHYQVTLAPGLKGERGYGLGTEIKRGATFRPKNAALIFPSSRIFARARQELRFAFLQVNTPAVTWKLACVPAEKLSAASARVAEFQTDLIDPVTGETVLDPRTGYEKPAPTELLIDALQLPVVATGNFEASGGDQEVRREFQCAPGAQETFSGAYLLEANATQPDGRTVGNRTLICVSDYLLTQKRSATKAFLRVAKMADGAALADAIVRAVTDENIELARAKTDQNGIATFAREIVFPEKGKSADLFIADTPNGPALQFARVSAFPSGDEHAGKFSERRAEIITDRNLYRPGQLVKIKGLVRETRADGLALPAARDVHYRIVQANTERVVAEGAATVSPAGGWEAEWTVPEKLKLGHHQIKCRVGEQDYDGTAEIAVEEYRVPLFSALVEAKPETGSTAHAQVSSAYFHGAPNAGAQVHWKANWSASADASESESVYRKRYNRYPELGPHLDPQNELLKTIEGDAELDAHGALTLSSDSPWKDNPAVGQASVAWRADVTSVDGQTITGGVLGELFAAPVRLGIVATESSTEAGVIAAIEAVDQTGAAVADVAVRAELFHVTTKIAKEQIAPFVYRYRNTDEFRKIAAQETKTPGKLTFKTPSTGRYVVAASAPQMKTPVVSDEATVTGDEPAELPVDDDHSFALEHRPEPFLPGTTALLTMKAPFSGVAWVSVETDDLLDTFLIPVNGNAARLEVPIKKEYAPNATVSVYLVRPGGANDLPRERFAHTEIEVLRPDRMLKLEARFAQKTAQPGETIRGEVQASIEGSATPAADLLVFAVDDAVLTLNDWHLPDVLGTFYPRNHFGVRTYEGLENYIAEISRMELSQKGFVIGGGGFEPAESVKSARKEFRTLAFWAGSLTTNADGKAPFEFVAPGNLTTYRLVAVGQTPRHQFGGDATQTIQISKPLLIDPALPRFLRDGDEVELRAVVRQSFAENEEVTLRCVTDGNCRLLAGDSATQTVKRDAPAVFRFKAKVADAALAPAKIRFEAVAKSDVKMNDTLELELPVAPPTIVRKESVAGILRGPDFAARSVLPAEWKEARGKISTTISTSPALPKLTGLPAILEYPHGCFEQISTKLLGYSLLANLLGYLPDAAARESEYREVLQRGLKQFQDALLENGTLPYWPGGEAGDAFVTCQAYWAANESARAGFEVPPELRKTLRRALDKILLGRIPTSHFHRCFALFVLTQDGAAENFSGPAADLYLHRNEGADESRALLALALERAKLMPREEQQLLRELDAPVRERAFHPRTFGSTTRAEAMCAFAWQTIAPQRWAGEKRKRVQNRLLDLMDSAEALSTQENLWLLLAFKAMFASENPERLRVSDPAAIVSKNGRSAEWPERNLGADLTVHGLNRSALTFLLRAEFSTAQAETERVDRGFRVERVLRNLTDPQRVGSVAAPLKIGDQLLVTYRLQTRKLQNYVALEDAMPAGIETLNPNLALVAKFFALPPPDVTDQLLALSHSEIHDRSTLLYFDTVEPGSATYSVLARATAAGTFRWPATQVVPMYDSRFSGLSPSSLCVVAGE